LIKAIKKFAIKHLEPRFYGALWCVGGSIFAAMVILAFADANIHRENAPQYELRALTNGVTASLYIRFPHHKQTAIPIMMTRTRVAKRPQYSSNFSRNAPKPKSMTVRPAASKTLAGAISIFQIEIDTL